MLKKLVLFVVLLFCLKSFANDGYKLWLQYDYIKNENLRSEYQAATSNLMSFGTSETIKIALKELELGLNGMLGSDYKSASKNSVLIFGNKTNLSNDILQKLGNSFTEINEEGYIIKSLFLKEKNHIVISGKTDLGVLWCFQLFKTHSNAKIH